MRSSTTFSVYFFFCSSTYQPMSPNKKLSFISPKLIHLPPSPSPHPPHPPHHLTPLSLHRHHIITSPSSPHPHPPHPPHPPHHLTTSPPLPSPAVHGASRLASLVYGVRLDVVAFTHRGPLAMMVTEKNKSVRWKERMFLLKDNFLFVQKKQKV